MEYEQKPDKKKKNKKEKNESKVDVLDEVGVQQIHSSEAGEEETNFEQSKTEKKKKKKDKKRKLNDISPTESVIEIVPAATAVSPTIDEEIDEEQERKRLKKEKKKQKKHEKDSSTSQHEKFSIPSSTTRNSSSNGSSSNLYHEHPSTSRLTVEQLASFREEHQIALDPADATVHFKPIENFEYLRPSIEVSCPYILNYITKKAFVKPSPIQSQCWPILLSGRDAIGIAATGSGKTLAFLIPAMLKIAHLPKIVIDRQNPVPSPRVLIIAPTRELAMQSHQVVEEMNGPKGVCIYGGVPKQQQKQDLRNGAEIVVATPGRLVDLIDERALSLSNIVYLVLDEADRMLDEGFEPIIQKILSLCPKSGDTIYHRQTVMFSATWPEEIRSLAEKYLKSNPIRITIGSDELSANHRVHQIVEVIQPHEKDRKLLSLLEKYHKSRKNRILIFILYKKEAVELQNKLQRHGYNVTAIHGDKSQYDRTAALEEFKKGEVPLMIATDVAARGLDIPQVEYVINYTFPLTVEEYVHRIGRTGRGGATGVSHTFFTDNEKGLAGGLVAVLQEANQEVPQEIYKYPLITKKKQSKLYGDFGPKTELAGKKATKITFDD